MAARHYELDAEIEVEESQRLGSTRREQRAARSRARQARINAEILREMALELLRDNQEQVT